MRSTSKLLFPLMSMLAMVAFCAITSVPAHAQTLQWLNSPVVVPSRITSAPNNSALATLPGEVNPFARAEYDQGRVNDSLPMEHMILLLQRSPDQEKMLAAVIDGLHNRKSPLYRHWLKPAQFGQHFGPSDHDLGVVTAWLQSQGFKIDQVPAGRTSIIFSGTAGQVRNSFHTEIHNLNVNGERHISNMSDPRIPAALAPVVSGFRSLNNFFAKPMMVNAGLARRDPKTHKWLKVSGPKTLREAAKNVHSEITDTTDGLFLVGPQDFYTIYNENALLNGTSCGGNPCNGTGVTVAVLEETDINPSDVATFQSQFLLPATTPNYLFGADGVFCTDPGILSDGEEGEADLDIQWAGAVAPAATVDFVSCASTTTSQGIDLSAMYVINDLSTSVAAMSLSYGGCEWEGQLPAVQFFTALWEQAAAQGQTVSVAAGDGGSMLCDTGSQGAQNPASVNFIADTPYNIAAGGTDFSDGYQTGFMDFSAYWNTTESMGSNGYESALSYVPEVAWGGQCSSPITASYLQSTGTTDFGSTFTPEAICNFDYTTTGAGLETVVGGSGGVSAYTGIPTWQSAYGVGLANTSTTTRNLPDLSLFASNGWLAHALVFCESDIASCDYSMDGTYPVAGGTSFVAPEIAGLMALVVQSTGAFQGVANYTLYNLASVEYGTPSNPNTTGLAACSGSGLGNAVGSTCIFQDVAGDTPCLAGGTTACNTGGTTITSDNAQACIFADYGLLPPGLNTCYEATTGDLLGISSESNTSFLDAFPTSQGYDAATGLGSVNITNLVTNWSAVSAAFPTTTTLAADPTILGATDSTTLTATVVATGRGGFVAPIGMVTFTSGGTTLGTGLLSSVCSGTPPNYSCGPATATLTVPATSLVAGENDIVASFPGDAANDAASTSPAVAVYVTSGGTTSSGTPLVVTTSSTLSIKGGDSASVSATIDTNPSGQNVGAITLTCAVVPAGPGCALSSNTVTSPGPATVTVTITTAASAASLHRTNMSWMFAMVLPGLLLLPAGCRSVRRRAAWLLCGLLLVLGLGIAGCGGSNKSQPYAVTITATATGATTGVAVISVDVHN